MPGPLISVVVIARNEESHIGRVLESALAAVAGLDSEVIFVDSASTDGTAAVARGFFAVRVIGLDPSWPLCPAAGRHIGGRAASGRFIFFLDGDTTLEPGFLETALPYIEAHDEVAALFGKRRECGRLSDGRTVVFKEDAYNIAEVRPYHPGDGIGGSGLYRAAALKEVGGFNPWLCSYEEAELCTRLYDSGHQLLFIPQPMIVHHDHRPTSLTELRRRLRQNLLLGRGQVLRLHPYRRPHYRGLARVLGMLAYMAALPALSLAALAGGGATPLLAWPVLMAMLYLLFVARARGVAKPLLYLALWAVEACKLVQGFARTPRDPADYPGC
ncbi:MAG: glycosyltransferase family A protein [Pseudomonadota bacterium]